MNIKLKDIIFDFINIHDPVYKIYLPFDPECGKFLRKGSFKNPQVNIDKRFDIIKVTRENGETKEKMKFEGRVKK